MNKKRYHAGEGECYVFRKNRCNFSFYTTENKGEEEPLSVEGAIGALWVEHSPLSKKYLTSSGLINIYKPTWTTNYFTGKTERPFRLYLKNERGNPLNYEWIEITVYANDNPNHPKALELKKQLQEKLLSQKESPKSESSLKFETSLKEEL